MFCIDQFKWKDKLVQVFERYQSGSSEKIYEKHRFYVVGEDDKVEFKVQTEYSAVAVEMGFEPYVLCASAKDYHATYGIGFTDNSSYEDIKAAVMQVLEEKIQPVASSRPGK